jgi:hypothetical protein
LIRVWAPLSTRTALAAFASTFTLPTSFTSPAARARDKVPAGR